MGLWDRLLGAPKGRHAAGARPAPSRAVVVPPSWSPAVTPVPFVAAPPPSLRQGTGAAAALNVPDAAAVAGPRGELTFRDGTTAELDPAQARELADLAAALTGRSEVKH